MKKYMAKKNEDPNKVEHDVNEWNKLKVIVTFIIGLLVSAVSLLPGYTFLKGKNETVIKQQINVESIPNIVFKNSMQDSLIVDHTYRLKTIESKIGQIDTMNANISFIKGQLMKR